MTNLQCKCLEINLLNSGEHYGHFRFRYLEGGEGATLATMIRRTLLSSIVESKIIGVRFAGVSDEFSSIEGVREDLLEIMLNLKEVIIKNPSYEPCYGRIKVFGPTIVTAGSLILPPNVTVVNPRSHILTICEESLVELEVRIEPGKIYALPQNRKTEGPGGFLNVDANFTPVLKVNSYIQSLFQEIDPLSQNIKNPSEELHLEIYTNGAILPHQALMIAANKLASLVLSCQTIVFPEKIRTKTQLYENKMAEKSSTFKGLKKKNKAQFNEILEKNSHRNETLESLGLSKRIIKILKKSNILNINDLLQISYLEPSQLNNIKGLGIVSRTEITEKLDLLSKKN